MSTPEKEETKVETGSEANLEALQSALDKLDEAGKVGSGEALMSLGTSATQLDLTMMDEQQLEKAKEELVAARRQHSLAEMTLLDANNEYSAADLSEEIEKYARTLQMNSSKKWYAFWQKATRIPKDAKYTNFKGEVKGWKQLVREGENNVTFILNGEKNDPDDVAKWKKVGSYGKVLVETCSYYSDIVDPEKKSVLYKSSTEFPFKPKQVLLALLRLSIVGKGEENLMYAREHYNFVGGQTFLFHYISKISASEKVAPRDFVELLNWSEKTNEDEKEEITISSQSVKGVLKGLQKVGIVRGYTALEGLRLTETEEGCKVETLVQMRANGWVPLWTVKWFFPAIAAARVENLQKGCELLVEEKSQEEIEEMIGKYVFREVEQGKESESSEE
eukprot:maker-scaffold_4-snap-gene-0.10-mRNA-1 protein AED:0.00 eAED:0.00 QI:105/1/1/1/1/1/2/123/390